MSNIDDIVDVIITRETTAVAQTTFNIAMVMGTHKVFNERIKYYSSLSEVVTDGFSSTTNEYKAAANLFGQDPRVSQIAIGRRSVDAATVTVSTVLDTALYTITINGTALTYQAESGDDATAIGEGLEAAINGSAEPVTAVNTAGTIVITADVENVAWTLTVGARLTISTYVASDTVGNDLTAINIANDNWYGLIFTSHVQDDVEDAAEWVQAEKKIYGTSSADADILDSEEEGDIASVLKAAGRSRTYVMYHADAASTFPEAAWMGVMFATRPGSSTFAFKSLTGPAVSGLDTTQRETLFDKNGNSYELRGGANVTMRGTMANGEFIDDIRGLDWLESLITTRIFSRLVNLPKIPFTDPGVAVVEAELRAALNQAIADGVLAADPAYTVTVPLVADVSSVDKANRNLPGVTFLATLAGAIHSITINGTVTV